MNRINSFIVVVCIVFLGRFLSLTLELLKIVLPKAVYIVPFFKFHCCFFCFFCFFAFQSKIFIRLCFCIVQNISYLCKKAILWIIKSVYDERHFNKNNYSLALQFTVVNGSGYGNCKLCISSTFSTFSCNSYVPLTPTFIYFSLLLPLPPRHVKWCKACKCC